MKPLLVVYDGMEDALETLLSQWNNFLKVGLFVNTEEPVPSWTLDDITPATFPGYPGLLTLTYWRPPAKVGDVFVANTSEVKWSKTGPGGGEYIQGVYVTDYAGSRLRWVQRFDKPVTVVYVGDVVTYRPSFSSGSLTLAKGANP